MIVSCAAALGWVVILALPWQPWRMGESFEAHPADARASLEDMTVLIPARDEAKTLGQVLDALAEQGSNLSVIVANDQSTDSTAQIARNHSIAPRVIDVPSLPQGWTGKLWALEQARRVATKQRLVLLDADIRLAPGTLAGLRAKADANGLALASLMAHLRMYYTIEKLLIPAFIYFFKLLYPFALSNAGSRFVKASAGGCVLIDANALDRIGGFSALANAIIDDCTLASKVREDGGKTWVGVTHSACSLRGYDSFQGISDMVARSAFTQLGYSTPLLIGATLAMVLLFIVPMAGLAIPKPVTRAVSSIGALAMMASYLPTLAYYRRAPAWALLMPIIGCLYLGMTWLSAIRYWRGRRSAWRGRVYAREKT